ncbi:hypothetical protein GCM10028809_59780 [Spirosoma gilvum]
MLFNQFVKNTVLTFLYEELLNKAIPYNLLYTDLVRQGFYMMTGFTLYVVLLNNRFTNQLLTFKFNAERLQKESVQTQYNALKNQVNPHFLFNNLSILSSLARTNASLSIQFINQMAKAYRYILEQKDHELVSIRSELDFLDAYIFLLKIRFQEKFFVTLAIPADQQTNYLIAPLTLQLLLENVIKHNTMSTAKPMMVTIKVVQDYIEVSNRLQLRQKPFYSTGIGLQNIVSRYALLSEQAVWIGQREDEFVVKVPLLK